MGESNKPVLLAVAAAVVMVLAGCAGGDAPGAVPVPPPAATSTPSAEPSAEPPSWPVRLVETTCDALVPEPLRDAAFDVPLPAVAGYSDAEGARSFYTTAFENAGGLSCRWLAPAGTGDREDDRVIAVQILPRAEAARVKIAQEMDSEQVTPDGAGFCNWRVCSVNTLVGEYWIATTVAGLPERGNEPGVPAEVAGVFDAVLATMAAVPASSEPVFPADAASWPTSCEQLVPEAELGAALGMEAAAFTSGYSYEEGNVHGAAVLTAGGLVCGLASATGSRFGSIHTLPGSAASFAAARAVALESGESENVQILGLSAEDAFLTQRQDIPGSAVLSINLGGTWAELSMAGAVHGESERPASERLTWLAEYLAARL